MARGFGRMHVPRTALTDEYTQLRSDVISCLDRIGEASSFVLGEEVSAFESEFAAYCQTRFCIGVNSGTSALHLALLATGIGHGDEVIIPPNTFIATAEAIAYTGARPVFADIDPDTQNIDPGRVEAAITPRTKAVVPVHLFGRPADMARILEIASRHRLVTIEDASQAHGARYQGRRVGGVGTAAGFSFYPAKNLGAFGEAGAVTTNDRRVAELARSLRDHGQTGPSIHTHIGFNYRMDGLQAGVLRIKLRLLDEWNHSRRAVAVQYRARLANLGVNIPRDDLCAESVYQLFPIYISHRDEVEDALRSLGVDVGVHYRTPIHLQPAFAGLGYKRGDFPVSEQACDQTLSLPLFPGMKPAQVEYCVKALAQCLE